MHFSFHNGSPLKQNQKCVYKYLTFQWLHLLACYFPVQGVRCGDCPEQATRDDWLDNTAVSRARNTNCLHS